MATVLLNQGAEFTVNSTIAAGQAVPAAKLLANGNIIVTWNDEPGSAVRAQIVTATGEKVGGEFQINQTDVAGQSQSNLQNSNITVLSNGDFVVTWVDNSHDFAGGDTSGSAVKYRVFHQDGTPASDELLANTRTLGNQTAPTVSALAGGQFVIVWQDANTQTPTDADASGSAIRSQIFNADGTKSGTETLVNTTVAGNQTSPFVTTLADGTYVVVWIDAAGSGDILGQRFTSDGSPSGAQFTIDADAATDTLPVITQVHNTGAGIGNTNNNFVVAWVSTTSGNADIHAIKFTYDTTNGTVGGLAGDQFVAGTEITINSLNGLAGNQNSPTLLATADGGFIVGFRDQNFATSSSTAAAMIRQYDASGNLVTYVDANGALVDAEQIVAPETSGLGDFGYKTVFPSLVQLANGNILAFYEERLGKGVDSNDESIRGTVFTPLTLKAGAAGIGTSANEALTATAGANSLILGRGGNDSLTGDTGNDVLLGGAGADLLRGGTTAQTAAGTDGIDTASYFDATSSVVADLKFGNNTGAVTGFSVQGDAVGDVFIAIDNLTGSNFNDRLYGDDANNELQGGKGDDVLGGRDGADTLKGGDGTDTADYSGATDSVALNLETGGTEGDAEGDVFNSIENVTGSEYDDVITGSSDGNALRGLGGDDVLDGGADYNTDQLYDGDIFDGGAGTDTVTYANAQSSVIADLTKGGGRALDGSAGDAQADTYISIENLTGSAFDDQLGGNAGNNVLNGGDGNDVLEGRAGNDSLIGGDGFDTASYASANAGVTANLASPAANAGHAKGDVYTSIEGLLGTRYADRLTGDTGSNIIEGGAGADTIIGGGGNDYVAYTLSNAGVTVNLATNAISGGHAQGDSLTGIANIIGSAFGDTLTGTTASNYLIGGAGADTVNGGAGNDWMSYIYSDAGVTVDLTLATQVGTGEENGDVLTNIEWLRGSSFDDSLNGNASANLLVGSDGDDVLQGRAGADTLNGGEGSDTASYANATARVIANLGNRTVNTGDAAGDQYSSIENLLGSAFNDRLYGNVGDNVIEGGAGADILVGGAEGDDGDTVSYSGSTVGVNVNLSLATAQSGGDAAGDYLSGFENVIGGSGADTLTGDDGDNVISGGAGADTLDGGDGADSFAYHLATDGGDTINNFQLASDVIVLDYAPDAFNFSATTPDFVFGTGATSTSATFYYNAANGELHFDSNGTTAGGDTLLATIYTGAGSGFAALTNANFRVENALAVVVDD